MSAICKEYGETVDSPAVKATAYYMLDCHAFVRLSGTPEQMVQTIAGRIKSPPNPDRPYTYGMLCPVRPIKGRHEFPEVGPCVHVRGSSNEEVADFIDRAQSWIDAVRARPDILALINQEPTK